MTIDLKWNSTTMQQIAIKLLEIKYKNKILLKLKQKGIEKD